MQLGVHTAPDGWAASRDDVPTAHRLAVVGMSCRYPGARGVEEFWELIRSGRSALTTLDDARLRAAGVPPHLARRPGYVPVAGLLDDPTAIDPAGLGISESEAELMDPQHRLFCECTIEALESAGLARDGHRGVVGVYAGSALSTYLLDNLGHRFHPGGGADPVTSLHLHGLNVGDYLPARVAWLLGLTGPTISVGATCATSLVAVHLAAEALFAQECDTAIAGGVSLRLPQERGYLAVPDGPFSQDGRTRSYGAGASGTVFTHGVGVVVLRRLEDALADGDPVHAVVLGTAIGNDGPDRAGFTAPSVSGQARVVTEALAVAAVGPRDVGLIEGHGTGTALGDPVEVRALNEVFGEADQAWCALGSVKSAIGHADSAAGVAGFIKAVLAVERGVLPPTIDATEPNPLLPLDESAFYLPTEPRPWHARQRIAGVSAFGIGGINAHVVVGSAPAAAAAPSATLPVTSRPRATSTVPGPVVTPPLLVSAADPEALTQRLADIAGVARDRGAAAHARLAGTLAHGVRHLPYRAALVGGEPTPTVTAGAARPRLVVVLPGGGAQYAGMAAGLAAAHPVFADSFADAARTITAAGGVDPRALALDPSATNAGDPRIGLPALVAVELAWLDLLAVYGVRPDIVLGHSVGEYAAAAHAGLMDRDDALRLVVERVRLMATLPRGAMLSLAAPEDVVTDLLSSHPDLDLAVVNGAQLSVVAGPEGAVMAAEAMCRRRGIEHRRLHVDVAAHSRLVEPIMPAICDVAAGFARRPPRIGVVSGLTGERITAALDPEYWARHLRGTVRFAQALDSAVDGAAHALVVQAGPGGDLVAGAHAAPSGGVVATLTGWPDRAEAADARSCVAAVSRVLGALWCHGVDVDLDALAPRTATTALPPYPWRRRPLALPSRIPADGALGAAAATDRPTADEPLQRPVWHVDPPRRPQRAGRPRSLHAEVRGAHPELVVAVTRALTDGGVTVGENADLLVHVSAPTDLAGLRAETGLFANTAREAAARAEAARAGDREDVPVRALLHVTLGAEDVRGDEPVTPSATATTGLARILAQEAGLTWATIDLDPAAPAWDGLADELARLADRSDRATADGTHHDAAPISAGDAQPHRALRGTRAWTRTWEPWRPVGAAELVDRDRPTTWLVTGGLGAVGLALAARVEAAFPQARVVLAGRTLPQAGDTRDCAVRALQRTEVEQVDVAQPGALTDLLARVRHRHGGLDVVVHAPVQVDLAPLGELDETGIDAAFGPKVIGATELVAAVDALPEAPRVVLLSSAAGTIGGFGLGAYVAAGRFLDGLAISRGWTTVDLDRLRLGTRAEAGSAAEISMRHALDLDDAVTVILRLVDLAVPGYVAASPDPLDPRTAHLDVRRTHRADTDGPAEALDGWEVVVADVWGRVLGRDISSAQADFFALGGHSLLATRVLATLRDEHGVDLRLRDLLSAPTIAECARLLGERAGAAGPGTAGRDLATAPAAARSAGAVAQLDDRAVPTDDGLPLTRVQHAYWIGRTRGLDPADPNGQGVGCHFYLEYEAHDLDVERYGRAWRRVIDRHPLLRAVATTDGEHRIVHVPADWSPLVIDLTDAPDQEGRLADLRERWSTRVADPARWPLIQPVVVRLSASSWRVLLSVDVLMCDSASWMRVDREVRACYLDPGADLGPAPLTFAACVMALEERARGARRTADEQWWRARLDALPDAPPIAAHLAAGLERNARPRFTRLAARVPARLWQPLMQEAAARRVTGTVVVLSRYRDVLARWSGQSRFTITMTVFDRPELPGVNDVVGEFTTMLLHEAQVRGDDAWEDVAATQQRLVDDLDHRDYTGLDVLDQLNRRRGRSANIPVVFTSMLGLTAHDHEWLGPQVHGVSQTPQVWLDHQAFEHRGDLVLQWDVCDSVVDLDQARARFAEYVDSFCVLATGQAPAPDPVPPTDDVASTLTRIWAGLLGLDPDDIGEESFLMLGGDSLMAVRMASEIRKRLGVSLPLNQVRADITIPDLVALLGGAGAAPGGMSLQRRPDAAAAFALLPLQQGYFVGQSGGWDNSYDTAHVTTDVALTLPHEHPDVDALTDLLQRAADAVAVHQPMVRAQILPDGTQRFRDAGDARGRTPVRVIDLRDTPDPHAGLDGLRRRWRVEGPDPRTGPGVLVDVVLLGGREARLHVSSSLLIMDGWSASLYDRELFAYLDNPGTIPAPLAIDFGDYVTSVTSDAARAELEEHRRWWWDRIDDLPAAPRLPRRAVAGPGYGATPGDLRPAGDRAHHRDPHTDYMAMREFRLAGQDWQRLRGACREHGVTPATALLGVFASILAERTGEAELLLNSMQHNRIPLHPDVDRLIGAFSRTALLPLQLVGGSPLDRFRDVAAQVEEYGRRHLITAVDVGREAARRQGRSFSIAPVVFQSTLGMDSALGGELDSRVGPFGQVHLGRFHQDIRTPQVELEMRFFELDGELIGSMASVDAVYADGLPGELLTAVEGRVRALLEPVGWSAQLPPIVPVAAAAAGGTAGDGHAVHEATLLSGTVVDTRDDDSGDVDPAADRAPFDADLVARIAASWSDILGLGETPTAAEDFFSLGGDSLLAIRMLLRLRDELGADVPPRAFLADPTVTGLARAVCRVRPDATPEPAAPCAPGQGARRPSSDADDLAGHDVEAMRDSLLTLREGQGRPIFWLHPSGGDILCYVELARLLRTDRPIVALSDPGLDGHAMPESIAGMVEVYRRLVTGHQAQGPWTLAGWSMGGTVAHELARGLVADGGCVDALVMVDSNSPERIIRLTGLDSADSDDRQRLRQLRSTEAFLGLDLGPHQTWQTLAEALVGCGAAASVDALTTRFPVFRRHLEGLALHEAGLLDASVPVLLVRADESSPRNSGEGMGVDDIGATDLGWGEWVAGPLHVLGIDAHHYSILRAPAVAHVADAVSEFLARASPHGTGQTLNQP